MLRDLTLSPPFWKDPVFQRGSTVDFMGLSFKKKGGNSQNWCLINLSNIPVKTTEWSVWIRAWKHQNQKPPRPSHSLRPFCARLNSSVPSATTKKARKMIYNWVFYMELLVSRRVFKNGCKMLIPTQSTDGFFGKSTRNHGFDRQIYRGFLWIFPSDPTWQMAPTPPEYFLSQPLKVVGGSLFQR